MTRPPIIAVVGVAAALLFSACGSTYTYVANSKTKTYFKIPDNWRLFSEKRKRHAVTVTFAPELAVIRAPPLLGGAAMTGAASSTISTRFIFRWEIGA